MSGFNCNSLYSSNTPNTNHYLNSLNSEWDFDDLMLDIDSNSEVSDVTTDDSDMSSPTSSTCASSPESCSVLKGIELGADAFSVDPSLISKQDIFKDEDALTTFPSLAYSLECPSSPTRTLCSEIDTVSIPSSCYSSAGGSFTTLKENLDLLRDLPLSTGSFQVSETEEDEQVYPQEITQLNRHKTKQYFGQKPDEQSKNPSVYANKINNENTITLDKISEMDKPDKIGHKRTGVLISATPRKRKYVKASSSAKRQDVSHSDILSPSSFTDTGQCQLLKETKFVPLPVLQQDSNYSLKSETNDTDIRCNVQKPINTLRGSVRFGTSRILQKFNDDSKNDRYYSRLNIYELSKILGLSQYHIELTKLVEFNILEIFKGVCPFKLGYQTWIRDTSKSTRIKLIDELYTYTKLFYPEFTKFQLEVIIRRGTYSLMQTRLRRERRLTS